MPQESIIRSMSAVCTDEASQDVQLDTWPYDRCIRWERVVGIDVDTQPTLILVGLKRGSEFYVARSTQPGAAGRSVHTAVGVEASGDHVPCVRFEGATAGDTLQLFAFGVFVVHDEGAEGG